MTIKTRTCLYIECNGCKEPIREDETGGIPHFNDAADLGEALGGRQPDGRFSEGWLDDVTAVGDRHYCAGCKYDPHPYVASDVPDFCLRCDRSEDEHDAIAAVAATFEVSS